MAIHSGELLYFRCPYHANVMKIFEIVSRRMVRTDYIWMPKGFSKSRAAIYAKRIIARVITAFVSRLFRLTPVLVGSRKLFRYSRVPARKGINRLPIIV